MKCYLSDIEASSRWIRLLWQIWDQIWNQRKNRHQLHIQHNPIRLAVDFINFFETFYSKISSKSRDSCDIEVVSRWIWQVSKNENRIWNLHKNWNWKVMTLGRIKLAADFINFFETFFFENFFKVSRFLRYRSRFSLNMTSIKKQKLDLKSNIHSNGIEARVPVILVSGVRVD